MKKKIVIVGAGASGLTAAIFAARAGGEVIVLEQMKRPALKVIASGGGHCNVTNVLDVEQLYPRFGRQGRFLLPALYFLSPEMLLEFFDELQVPCICNDRFHYFPKSQKATDIVDALTKECQRLKVTIKCNQKVKDLIIADDGKVCGVRTEESKHHAEHTILACGGKSYRSLGGTGGGYPLAEQVGHSITSLFPGLVGLKVSEDWVGTHAGLVFKDCKVMIDLPRHRKNIFNGDLLFTHKGISGPVIIDISANVAELLRTSQTVSLKINLYPKYDKQYWEDIMKIWREKHGKRQLNNLLSQHIPKLLANRFLHLINCNPTSKAAQLSSNNSKALVDLLHTLPLTITACESFQQAMVTRGGIMLKEIDPNTMKSKLCQGLSCCGELLDVDGPCGGFNLQWAFSSGALAGNQA